MRNGFLLILILIFSRYLYSVNQDQPKHSGFSFLEARTWSLYSLNQNSEDWQEYGLSSGFKTGKIKLLTGIISFNRFQKKDMTGLVKVSEIPFYKETKADIEFQHTFDSDFQYRNYLACYLIKAYGQYVLDAGWVFKDYQYSKIHALNVGYEKYFKSPLFFRISLSSSINENSSVAGSGNFSLFFDRDRWRIGATGSVGQEIIEIYQGERKVNFLEISLQSRHVVNHFIIQPALSQYLNNNHNQRLALSVNLTFK